MLQLINRFAKFRKLYPAALVIAAILLPAPFVAGKTLPGIDVLRANHYIILKGKRVGLLTHPAGVDSNGVSTLEILHKAKTVKLVALFGPEHGIYGDENANEPVDNQIDPKTRLPVYSLYGKYRTPTKGMLKNLDVMVIDLQDIGVRSYTYISCMRLTLEACFRNKVEVVILDRPNPLGGLKVDGPVLEKGLRSYVGAFMIPYVHGLTIGELARLAKFTAGWLDISDKMRKKGKLTVVPMEGWTRSMTWNQTGLAWIPTSPIIPNLSAVLGYAMTGLGSEINGFRHGYGTEYPFRLLSHREVTTDALLHALKGLDIPGMQFAKTEASNPRGEKVEGVYVQVSNWASLSPTSLSFLMMSLACKLEGRNPYQVASKNRINLFNKHVGSNAWWKEISTRGSRANVENYLARWKSDSADFKSWASQYWIYPEQ